MKRNIIRIIITISLALVFISLFIYNFKNNSTFFDIPVYTILNLIVATFFAFYLTQKKQDERKFKETAERLIYKIQNTISSEKMYRIKNEKDIEDLKLTHRTISNRIETLDKLKDKLNYKKEIEYIKDKFKTYRELFGNHINDVNHLTNSERDLFNFIELIDNKLDEILLSLFL